MINKHPLRTTVESGIRFALLATFFVAACGDEPPVSSEAEQAATTSALPIADAPPVVPQQAQIPGFGPVVIRMRGTEPAPGSAANYIGDCDDMRPPDDDVEVMSFYAPWKNVGNGSGGNGARFGTPVTRSFEFEKAPDLTVVRLRLDFGREKSNLTAADQTDGLPKVADLVFGTGTGTVGLFRVSETHDLLAGYAAIFPLVEVEGMPEEPGLTNRYLAKVQLVSLGLPEFEGWTEAEIIRLFASFYASRCLGEGLKQAWAPFAPTVIYE